MDGKIVARVEAPIPNTAMYLVSFDVKYTRIAPSEDDDDEGGGEGAQKAHEPGVVVEESGVKVDRIRMVGTPDGELLYPLVAENRWSAPSLRNENTGNSSSFFSTQ
ncbi:MAG: hypothetical protein RIS22_79 [Actinomycetota bacterium]|jgi:hypothetical protein